MTDATSQRLQSRLARRRTAPASEPGTTQRGRTTCSGRSGWRRYREIESEGKGERGAGGSQTGVVGRLVGQLVGLSAEGVSGKWRWRLSERCGRRDRDGWAGSVAGARDANRPVTGSAFSRPLSRHLLGNTNLPQATGMRLQRGGHIVQQRFHFTLPPSSNGRPRFMVLGQQMLASHPNAEVCPDW